MQKQTEKTEHLEKRWKTGMKIKLYIAMPLDFLCICPNRCGSRTPPTRERASCNTVETSRFA